MAHTYLFSSIAHTIQARLQNGADIDALATLDRKDWLILSCPIADLGEGEKVAKLLDTDQDGRVRIPEILAAVDWLRPRLQHFDCLFQSAQGLRIEDICTTTQEGEILAKVFAKLATDGCLTENAIDGAIAAFRSQLDNGDCVVPASAAGEAWTAMGELILAVTGGAPAVDGTMGIARQTLDQFLEARTAFLAWREAEPKLTIELADVATAVMTFEKMKEKIDAFFLACGMVRYNPATEKNFTVPTAMDALANAPLCLPEATCYALPFEKGINPLYLEDMAVLAQVALAIDKTAEELDMALWKKVQAILQPISQWRAAKPHGADSFAALDAATFEKTADTAMLQAFTQAIETDAAQAPLAATFEDLHRLVVLRMNFLRFLRNFVNVEDLYPPTAKALFQVGTLFMDGRACSLCFPISAAPTAHATAAQKANCCLAYCSLKHNGQTKTICAVFTAGSIANLAVGSNGVFYDYEGQTWEATIVHLVANPMGLREAFLQPWRKMVEAFTSSISKFITAKNDEVTKSLTSTAESAAQNMTSGTKAAPSNNGLNMATIATLGIALSFLATAVTGILSALTATPLWKTLLVLLGLVCVVSLPSVILTWLKLRSRNLAPILNASGWAVNRRIGLTPGLGRYFTQEARVFGKRFIPAKLPTHIPWLKIFTLLVALLLGITVAWYFFCPTSPRQKCVEAKTCCDVAPTCEDTVATPPVEAPAVVATPETASTEVK